MMTFRVINYGWCKHGEEKRNAYRILVRKPEGKERPGRLGIVGQHLNGFLKEKMGRRRLDPFVQDRTSEYANE
jgi:hypothetical protein